MEKAAGQSRAVRNLSGATLAPRKSNINRNPFGYNPAVKIPVRAAPRCGFLGLRTLAAPQVSYRNFIDQIEPAAKW